MGGKGSVRQQLKKAGIITAVGVPLPKYDPCLGKNRALWDVKETKRWGREEKDPNKRLSKRVCRQ